MKSSFATSVAGTTDVLRQALRWHEEGNAVVLATVIETWGSAPRRAGAHMVISGNGDFAGSVSGGCVETAVVEESHRVVAEGAPRTVEYGVSDEDAWAVGLACGGRVRVHLEALGAGGLDPGLLDRVVRAREAQDPVVLVHGLAAPAHWLLRPMDGAAGTEEMERLLVEHAREVLRSDRPSVVDTRVGPVFLRPHNPAVRVIVVGAVHLTQALIPVVSAAGFSAVVVDPRDAFATSARFPDVPLVHSWPGEALRSLHPDHRTAIVVVTHDPKLDDPALVEALAGDAFYVGALGSRRTHARRLERLREQGVPEADLDRIAAPVGMDIGARAPGEIAVAIVAELIAALRRPGRSG